MPPMHPVDQGSARSAGPRWVVLTVPLALLASLCALAWGQQFTGDTFADCAHPGPSLRMLVAGWAAPLLSLGVYVLYPLLRHRAVRAGHLEREGWQWRAAGCVLHLAALAAMVEIPVLVEMYTRVPVPDCSG